MLMATYNRKGVFNTINDDLDGCVPGSVRVWKMRSFNE